MAEPIDDERQRERDAAQALTQDPRDVLADLSRVRDELAVASTSIPTLLTHIADLERAIDAVEEELAPKKAQLRALRARLEKVRGDEPLKDQIARVRDAMGIPPLESKDKA